MVMHVIRSFYVRHLHPMRASLKQVSLYEGRHVCMYIHLHILMYEVDAPV